MVCVVFLDDGVAIAGAGADVIPAALNWSDITVTNPYVGYESNQGSEQTISGITANSQITLRAAWSSTSSSPARGYWVKNGTMVAAPAATPVEVNVANGDKVFFVSYVAYTLPSGNYDTGTVRVTNESRKATVTVTIATPGVFTWSSHGLSAGDKVLLRTTGALPTNLTVETVYYVIASGLSTDEFQLSTTAGGAAIDTTGTQSGTHTAVFVEDTFTFAAQYVYVSGSGTVGGAGTGGERWPPAASEVS